MELIFKLIVSFTVVQRIAELFWSKRNEKYILELGGKIIPEKNYLFMVVLHTTWLIGLVYYAFLTKLNVANNSSYFFFTFFILGQILRITAISTLGKRWSTRIVILPKAPVVKKGIFNFIRHPNYLGVILEIAALPLMGGLIGFSIIFSLLNFVILFFRIKEEEQCLNEFNNYYDTFNMSK